MSSAILHIEDLAREAGVSARTVRYYISRGLLPGPVMMGRKAHYTQVHLEVLRGIVRQQAEGRTLDQIKNSFVETRRSAGDIPSVKFKSDVPEPELIVSYTVAPDVRVSVGNDIAPQRKRVIHQALATFARAVRVTEEEKE